MRLIEDAAQRAYRDFALLGHDRYVNNFVQPANELDVAALLSGFNKAGRFQTALDFAKR